MTGLKPTISCLRVHYLMPPSQMAYEVSAAPLWRISLHAMILQFYGAGKAAAAIIAATAATAVQRGVKIFFKIAGIVGLGGGEVTSCGYIASLQCLHG